jgi:hypothetical protein
MLVPICTPLKTCKVWIVTEDKTAIQMKSQSEIRRLSAFCTKYAICGAEVL